MILNTEFLSWQKKASWVKMKDGRLIQACETEVDSVSAPYFLALIVDECVS